jgi:hypothetical protein
MSGRKSSPRLLSKQKTLKKKKTLSNHFRQPGTKQNKTTNLYVVYSCIYRFRKRIERIHTEVLIVAGRRKVELFFFFYYSYVHTKLGSFLLPAPTPSLTTPSTSSLSPPTPSIPSRNYFALISNFVVERV